MKADLAGSDTVIATARMSALMGSGLGFAAPE